jgi:hypothetical protein
MSLSLDELLEQQEKGYEENTKAETFQLDPRILKFKAGGTYTGRFVVNGKDPMNSRIAYSEYAFKSPVDGTYVYAGRDPCDERDENGRPKIGQDKEIVNKTKWAEYKKAKDEGTDKDQNAPYKLLNNKRKEMVNFYLHKVEGDEAAQAKVGQVLVIRYPAQRMKDKKTDQMVPSSDILKKIESGLRGDKAKKIGKLAWKLDKTGRSFTIKVTEKGGYLNYSDSEFEDAEDLGLSAKQIEDIINNKAHNLLEFIPEVKPQDELKEILDIHYFGTSASPEDEVDDSELPEDDEDDQIPGLGKSKSDKDDEEFDLSDLD